MRPGISRALVGGLLGFAVGAAVVVALRVTFGFTPYWNLGLVLVLGVFTSVYGVIWGIGGMNPVMSEHPDDSKPEPTIEEMAEQSGWRGMLSSVTWQMTALMVIMMFGLIAFALIPGSGLNITTVADASPKEFGTVNIPLFGEEIPINQGALLIGFILFTMLSLAIAGAVLSGVFYALSRGVENAANTEPPVPGAPRENVNPLMRRAGNFAGTLADRIAPPEDKETTAVVAKEES